MKGTDLPLADELKLLLKAGRHKSKKDLLREALRLYKEAHPEAKLEIALVLYEADKISLARAVELAGTDPESFKAILAGRKLPVKTALGSRAEIARARKRL